MEFLIILFLMIGAIPLFCLYLFDRFAGNNHQAAIKKFNVTLAIVGISPLMAFILSLGLFLIYFSLIFLVGIFSTEAEYFFSKIINRHIFESPLGAALSAIVIFVIATVRAIYRDPEMLFEYNPNTKKIEPKKF